MHPAGRHAIAEEVRVPEHPAEREGIETLRPEDAPKYLNGPETAVFKKASTLYALDLARACDIEGRRAALFGGGFAAFVEERERSRAAAKAAFEADVAAGAVEHQLGDPLHALRRAQEHVLGLVVARRAAVAVRPPRPRPRQLPERG